MEAPKSHSNASCIVGTHAKEDGRLENERSRTDGQERTEMKRGGLVLTSYSHVGRVSSSKEMGMWMI